MKKSGVKLRFSSHLDHMLRSVPMYKDSKELTFHKFMIRNITVRLDAYLTLTLLGPASAHLQLLPEVSSVTAGNMLTPAIPNSKELQPCGTHVKIVLSNFSELIAGRFYNSPHLSDVTIGIGNETIYAHKVVLAVESTFFSALFQEPYAQSDSSASYQAFWADKARSEVRFDGKAIHLDTERHSRAGVAML